MTMLNRLFIILIFSFSVMSVQAETEIGQTVFARGITMAESLRGEIRVLSSDSKIYEGDTLTTGEKSFVVLEFNDGTRMSLRPNTIFQLEQFKLENNKADVRLFTGGLRASTGTISQKNPDGFKLHVKNTTGNVGLGTQTPAYQLQLSANSAAKPTTSTWTVASDRRLKENIKPYKGGLSDVLEITPVWFTYNGKAGMPKDTGVGVIAQDLQRIA
ncbi:MAG: hypothetical protein COC04_04100, partial [Gammaproteobacteria bacterium]